jgi:hypothetical protein
MDRRGLRGAAAHNAGNCRLRFLQGLKGTTSIAAVLKRVLIGICLTLCVAACASLRATPDTAKPVAAATAQHPRAGCVATGTRIPVSPEDCAAFGRSWAGLDIKSTGATDAAQVLRQLDPTVTVTGH